MYSIEMWFYIVLIFLEGKGRQVVLFQTLNPQ